MIPTLRRFALLPLAALLLVTLPACDSGGDEDDGGGATSDLIFLGVNYDRLFAEPTAAEVQAVRDDWAGRTPTAEDAVVVSEQAVDGATLYVVTHTMDEGPGAPLTHYGVVRVPDGASEAPVLVVHHGGDDGFGVNDPGGNSGVTDQAALYPDLFAQTVQVFPTYRSEPLRLDGTALTCAGGAAGPCVSGGTTSPWDYDVDDAMALLSSALQLFPDATDADRVAALGYSRGANTAVLHAIRDSRVDAVTEYYGPTDFYNPVVTSISNPTGLAAAALLGAPAALGLPGVAYIRTEVLDPLRNEDGSYNPAADYVTARLEVIRRSASVFTADIPDLQVHHHVADPVVPYGFSQAFNAAVSAQPNDGSYDFNEYSNALPAGVDSPHRPEAMPASLADTEGFLLGVLGAPAARERVLSF